MNRLLKERMIGAAVLVAIAIILIPEMLSGPHSPQLAEEAGSASTDNSKLKTYTIDLTKAAAPAAHVESTQSLAPTIAETPPVTAPTPAAEEKPAAQSAATGVAPSEKPPAAPKSEVRPAAEPVTKPAPIKKPEADAAPIGGWTVQVGSFGVRATSDRVAGDLKRAGFPAFVVAFQAGAQTMYRVRVGPVRDRPAAEELLRKLKSQHPTAAIVPPA